MIVFRFLHFAAALFFSLSAYVQINDPDSQIWMVIYFIPAILSLLTVINPEFTEHPLICKCNDMIIVTYCLYGGFILDSQYDFKQDLLHWIIHEESGREFGGLAIVSLWSGLMHGSARSFSKAGLVILSSIIIVPAAFWAFVYFDQSFRSLWPEHCQSALYPNLAKSSLKL